MYILFLLLRFVDIIIRTLSSGTYVYRNCILSYLETKSPRPIHLKLQSYTSQWDREIKSASECNLCGKFDKSGLPGTSI